MKDYPLGVQTFEKIIANDLLYIDKTKSIHALIRTGGYYFYARPRRFGKSLTLSTIRAIYEGKKDLFEGLWIANQWDWSKVHPIIHLGFSSMNYQDKSLDAAIADRLKMAAKEHGLQLEKEYAKDLFFEFIVSLAKQKGKVVLLLDEYDKPIIDYLGQIELAKKNRDTLKAFYSVIKDCDPYIEFMMITGVSKFSKVSIFSELNNLTDITFHRRYSTLTGITQQELETHFDAAIMAIAKEMDTTPAALKQEIKQWYDGYSWDGKHFLYNPYSILSFFDFVAFKNFWFETGTPSFLLDLMSRQEKISVNNIKVSNVIFSAYNIEHLESIAILFQTGYLTIKKRENHDIYLLDYPNLEVRDSMMRLQQQSQNH
ncbi:MAG: AAA family ATPase [Bacteroidota bacterium]